MKNFGFMELNDGGITFGRQIGSYPLLVGIPYKLETGRFFDVFVTDWGYRSITGVTYPFDVNSMPLSALEALPGIGKKRAAKMVLERPFSGLDDLGRAIDDRTVIEGLRDIVVFRRCGVHAQAPFEFTARLKHVRGGSRDLRKDEEGPDLQGAHEGSARPLPHIERVYSRNGGRGAEESKGDVEERRHRAHKRRARIV
jgi:hypothetical protein